MFRVPTAVIMSKYKGQTDVSKSPATARSSADRYTAQTASAVQKASKHCPKECSFGAGTDGSLQEGPESEVVVDARGTGRI